VVIYNFFGNYHTHPDFLNFNILCIHLETVGNRTPEIRSVSRVEKIVQRPHATTHSYTCFPVVQAAGSMILPMVVILYEPRGAPLKFENEIAPFTNLKVM
jgi:hypothetical protein